MDTQTVRRTLGVLLLGVSLSAAACTSTEPGTTTTTPVLQTFPDEAFTAEFPSGPKREVQTQTVAGVPVTLIMYQTGDVVVGYVNYPTSLSGSLDGAVKGAADNIKGTIMSRKDTTFMGHPATDVVIKAPEGIVHSRMVLRGQRLYSLIGGGPSGPPPAYARLVETFVLL
ncbi:MAG TPA: hypothetical protein VJ653_05575 [Acidimicrobiales bacterium]|nr:hypothetical protein [Acidimicrobiales bacterium]